MSDQRIEPRLRQELRRGEGGRDPARRIPVLIELVRTVEIPPVADPGERLAELESQTRELQRGIVTRLGELGVREGEIHRFSLGNALAVVLTPAQIAEIARHPDVKLVRWNRADRVDL